MCVKHVTLHRKYIPLRSEIKPVINSPVVCCLLPLSLFLSGDVAVASYLGLGNVLCFHEISKHLNLKCDYETRGTVLIEINAAKITFQSRKMAQLKLFGLKSLFVFKNLCFFVEACVEFPVYH